MAWNLILLAAAGLLVMEIAAQPFDVSHDAALYLDCGRLITEGLRPYVDFVDLNPPLIMYVSALPALMAGRLGLHLIASFHVFVLGLVVYSGLASRAVLVRSRMGLREHETQWPALQVVLFSLYLTKQPFSDWGQREHLFVLLYLPYFFLRWVRWSGGSASHGIAAVVGLTAAVGVCLKPHFVLIGLALDAIQFLRVRRIRPLFQPEVAAFVLAGMAYAAHFVLLPEEVREAFFHRWIPMIDSGYSAYNETWSKVLIRPATAVALAGSGVGLWVAGRWKTPRLALVGLFGCFALLAILLYALQHKGWRYQSIPAAFAGLAACLSAASARNARKPDRVVSWPTLPFAVCILGAAALVGGLTRWVELQADTGPRREKVMQEIIDRLAAKDDPLLMLSTSVPRVYPLLLQIDRKAASRYLWTFPLPMLYAAEKGRDGADFPYRRREAMGEEELRFINDLKADILQNRPGLILIDKWEKPQGCPEGFVLPGYFRASGFLEREMAGYRYWNSVYGWDVYLPAGSPAVREKSKS